MTPLFPRSGPGESGSPMSAVILRCYDFPARIPGHLFVSLPGSTLPPRFVPRSLRSRSRKDGRCLPGRGHCSAGDPIAGLLSRGRERDLPGSQAIHPVPLPRSTTPAESTIPSPIVGFVDATPAQTTAKASASWLYRGYRGASAPVAYASRMVLPPSMQGSLPAGWLAFTGRELNPLDRDEGFQITSSSLPGLFLAQRPKTCTEHRTRLPRCKSDRRNFAPRPYAPCSQVPRVVLPPLGQGCGS